MRDCKGSEVVSDILVARYKGYKVASPFGEAFFVLASGSMGEPAYFALIKELNQELANAAREQEKEEFC